MKPSSAHLQRGNVAHAGFLFVLLLILALGIATRHALVDGYVEQTLDRHAVQTRHLAARMLERNPEFFRDRGSQPPAEDSSAPDLHQAVNEFWPAAPGEQVHYRLYNRDGRVLLSADRVEQGEIASDRIHSWILQKQQQNRWLSREESADLTGSQQPVESLYSLVPLGESQSSDYLEIVSPAPVNGVSDINRVIVLAMLALLAAILFWLYGLNRLLQRAAYVQGTELERRSHHDDLTGLPNRVLFWDRLEQAIAHARRDEKLVALIRINIDRFQRLNHALGHAIADRLLVELSQRLRGIMRASDTLVRMCADDFAIIIGESERKDEIEKAILRMMEVANEPYIFDEHEIDITTRVGIAVYPTDHQDEEKLLMAADAAMQQAKQNGSQRIAFYTPEMGEGSAGRLKAEYGLRQALENKQFELHYQPKVDSTTGRVKGFEALIRWQHPERGLVPPLEFIPILEESGLIIPVGEWVIREACAASQRWQQQGLPILPISVNVAAPQFEQENFTQRVKQILQESDAQPQNLEIEVTESCLMSDVSTSAQVLSELKSLGVNIAVDDFGTGYSSLSHLKRFPIDTLKIDRSFVTNVNNRAENDNASIVTAIMALSHSLRLDVVAEGVETARELAYLHALGCHTIQGFLFSRPLVENEVVNLLQDSVSMQQVLASVREELKI